jgi:hypothetical protein
MDRGAGDEPVRDIVKIPNLYLKKRKRRRRPCGVCGGFRKQTLINTKRMTRVYLNRLRKSSCAWCSLLFSILERQCPFELSYDREILRYARTTLRFTARGVLSATSALQYANEHFDFVSHIYDELGKASSSSLELAHIKTPGSGFPSLSSPSFPLESSTVHIQTNDRLGQQHTYD